MAPLGRKLPTLSGEGERKLIKIIEIFFENIPKFQKITDIISERDKKEVIYNENKKR